MAKSDTSLKGIFEPMNSIGTMFAANTAMGSQARHFWQAQDRMLGEAEKFSSAWLKRRHEATQSALRASQEIASHGASDPAAAMKVIADWQAHSMERLANDAKDYMEMMTRCTNVAATNEAEAMGETAEAAKKSPKPTKSEPV